MQLELPHGGGMDFQRVPQGLPMGSTPMEYPPHGSPEALGEACGIVFCLIVLPFLCLLFLFLLLLLLLPPPLLLLLVLLLLLPRLRLGLRRLGLGLRLGLRLRLRLQSAQLHLW